jgi:hypothetical protein
MWVATVGGVFGILAMNKPHQQSRFLKSVTRLVIPVPGPIPTGGPSTIPNRQWWHLWPKKFPTWCAAHFS